MFTINRYQEEILSKLKTDSFRKDIDIFLRSNFANFIDGVYNGTDFDFDSSISASLKYGLKTRFQISSFVSVSFLICQDFYLKFGEINAVLRSSGITEDEKAAFLIIWCNKVYSTLYGGKKWVKLLES